MSDTPTMVEVNCTTGEVIERPFTAEEIAQHEIDVAAATARKTAEDTAAAALATLKATAKASAQAKLAALGLTAAEIAAL